MREEVRGKKLRWAKVGFDVFLGTRNDVVM